MNDSIGPAPLLLTVRDLQQRLRLGRTATYAKTREAGFPRPIRIGRAYLWRAEEIDGWIEGLDRIDREVLKKPARVASKALTRSGHALVAIRPVETRSRGRRVPEAAKTG